jgi:hypothetical protein
MRGVAIPLGGCVQLPMHNNNSTASSDLPASIPLGHNLTDEIHVSVGLDLPQAKR